MMKKFLVYSIVGLSLCLAIGCKKSESIKKTYLLTQEIIDYRPANYPVDTITYTYDNHDRVIKVRDPTDQAKGNSSISYGADGRVDTAYRLTNSGAVILEYDYFYTPASTGYYFHGPSHPRDTAVFTFNDKKQVTKTTSHRGGYSLYTYDGQGNITTSEGYNSGGTNSLLDHNTFLYDTQKNPFFQQSPGNYFFMFVANTDPSTLINNIKFKNGDTYTYTYNSDGFPEKGTINIGSALIPVYFIYTVK